MISISKPIGAGTVRTYYAQDYTASNSKSYYSQNGTLNGHWHGLLARELGLIGVVREAEYGRLSEGQHPETGEQLIKHRETVLTKKGKEIGHRAAWDIVFNAPKTVTVTALIGGDERVVQAHRAAVRVALDAMEGYTQLRLGGDKRPLTTGKWVVAVFEHDTARPVGAAPPDPHTHTHAVLFNFGKDGDKFRSLQTQELFRVQSFATAVYQAELAWHLQRLGYKLDIGQSYAPEIAGYTSEYLKSVSKRHEQIVDRKEELGVRGAEAGEIVAKSTRSDKQMWLPEELRAKHLEDAAQHGNQHEAVMAAASPRATVSTEGLHGRLQAALDHARERLSERNAVFDRFEVLRDALRHGMGKFRLSDVEPALDARRDTGDFVPVRHYRWNAPGERYTTPEAIAMERAVIEYVRTAAPVAPIEPAGESQTERPNLNAGQQSVVRQILASDARIQALQGSAGTGKSFALKAISDAATAAGFEVCGLAPTSQAANNLSREGIKTDTLQGFLVSGNNTPTCGEVNVGNVGEMRPKLFFLDESSLASTRQVHELLERLAPQDRVVLVGDVKQHQSVEAGRIFDELQQAGMQTACLDQIIRQKDPQLKAAVELLAAGSVPEAVRLMRESGRVLEVQHRAKRFSTLAQDYVSNPVGTLVISPDNESRQELNQAIRTALQDAGAVERTGVRQTILIPRQEVTGADRKVAQSYRPGDVVRYHRGNKAVGIDKGAYASVVSSDRERREVTVQFADGSRKSYDPARCHGVQLYELGTREFAVGDRLQFTAPVKSRGIANREMATITKIQGDGAATLRLMASERTVEMNLSKLAHVDYGYATTSYSSQSLTCERVLIQAACGDPNARNLLGRELAYVAVSRAREDVIIYTDSAERLSKALDRTHEKGKALSPAQIDQYRDQEIAYA